MKTQANNTDMQTELDIHDAVILERSEPFVGRWNHLISSTNWEKGEIICQWRREIDAPNESNGSRSDEAWSRLVGGVSPQHVGRLRRTYERFGEVFKTYPGLYWSHFYGALDWDDAEMWLEGAVQNKWSVTKMRLNRWETLGLPESEKPREKDFSTTEIDEETASLSTGTEPTSDRKRQRDSDYVEGPLYEGPDFGDEPATGSRQKDGSIDEVTAAQMSLVPPEKLFAELTDLPDDVETAVENFKLAIIRHKAGGWAEISQEKLIRVLVALQKLAQTPLQS